MTPNAAVEAVLVAALKERGVREVGGNNRGPRVEEYLRRVHWTPGAPWCAAFVGWCGSEALGKAWPLPLVPGTYTLLDFAHQHGWVRREPQRGLVFLVWSSARRSWHTGFIQSLVPGGWRTIEGNTGPDGGHDGDGVYEKVRTFTPKDTFIDWTLGLQEDA